MRTKLKLMLVLASLGALGVLATAGAASAGEGPRDIFAAGDPMTTNVPYVAWAGEEVRLVKCIDDPGHAWEGTSAEWAIVDSSVRQRSGDLRDPVFFDDTDRRTEDFVGGGEQSGRTCWAIDVDSVNPGMTRIKMAVDGNEGTPGSPILKHDFLVVWLAMGNPVLTELSSAAFPGQDVGDPLGDGNFTAIDGSFSNGLIRATVAGSFTDLHGNARTLPTDWASLAGLYANDDVPIRYDTDVPVSMRWDIHDDQSEESIHSALSFCAPPKAGTIDGVDNCLGSGILGEIGPFSRTVGGTFATVGPFDPARPGSSYLPNGRLDAGDAPMPAARIDVQLNGTVGALEEADKHELYSRDRTGNGDPHNLYAPFNVALIPADISQAFPDYTTSGTTGPAANNFPGYQTQGVFGAGTPRAYHYWDFLLQRERASTPNVCHDVGGSGQFGDGVLIPAPRGIDRATVYTDEHGEAILEFNPDVGASLVANNQGLCDLGEVNGAALLGSATITAQALDPYEPTFSSARNANSLTKNVYELAGKSLDCLAKSAIEVFCVEVIRDIRGNPVVGAPVSFTREPRGLILPGSLAIAPYDTRGQTVVSEGVDEVIVRTNSLGQAGVVLKSTLPGLVDLDAENIGTRNGGFGVQRVRCIRFAGDGVTLPTDGATCVSPTDGGTVIPTPPGGGGTQPIVNPTVTQQAAAPAATVVSLAGNPVPASAAPAAKAPAAKKAALKLASARLVFANGKRFLVVRANGAAKTAKVRITLVMRTGKVATPVVRTINTNKAVRVANLQISKHVRTVRVSLVR